MFSGKKEQTREGLQKDIWFSKKGERSHFKVQSDLSYLELLSKQKKQIEVKENLKNIKGWYQEGERQRYFEAKEGDYLFPSNNFFARDISFSLTLNNNPPTFWGRSDKFLLFNAEKPPYTISADKMLWKDEEKKLSLQNDVHVKNTLSMPTNRAKIFKEEGKIIANGKSEFHHKDNTSFTCNGEVVLDNEKKTITAMGCEQLLFKNDKLMLFSDYLTLNYKTKDDSSNNPLVEDVIFEGNVKLITILASKLGDKDVKGSLKNDSVKSHTDCDSKRADTNKKGKLFDTSCKSFATCDKLHYFPKQDKMILSVNPPKKVIFWQEDGSLCMTTQEIIIKDKNVQGVGKVHFSLSSDEESLMKQLFSPFLKNL